MGMGTSVTLEDRDMDLWRSFHTINEACMVSERCCRGKGFQMSRSNRERKSKVGLKACSMLRQGAFGMVVNYVLIWVSREA